MRLTNDCPARVRTGNPIHSASLAVVPYLLIISPYVNITDEDCERANHGWKRFIWLNFFAGALISLVVINYFQAN
jgi:hypothetical protein